MPSFLKGKIEPKSSQDRVNKALEIDQRVVTFIEDYPVRGTVRYISEEKDLSGNVRIILGLEMVGNPCWNCVCRGLNLFSVKNLTQ